MTDRPKDVMAIARSYADQISFGSYEFNTLRIADAIMQDRASRIRSCLLDKAEAVEAEPVAWRWCWKTTGSELEQRFADPDLYQWTYCETCPTGDAAKKMIIEPLYAHPASADEIERPTSGFPEAPRKVFEKAAPNEITDFLYKHGDLTYSAASSAVRLLTGNGYGFTRAALTQEPTNE